MSQMIRFLRAPLLYFIEPAFIELKASLLAYLVILPTWTSVLLVFAAFIFISFVIEAVVIFEGTKSLWSIYWLVRRSEGGVVRIEDVIPEETLAAEYGYIHRAFRFGRRNPDAGKMTLLYDPSGNNTDYQCAFNMRGNSYLFTSSNLSINDMPDVQKYLTFHELGHGSMLGGMIWINGKSAFFGGTSAALFSITVSHITSLGVIAISFVLLVMVFIPGNLLLRVERRHLQIPTRSSRSRNRIPTPL